MKTKTLKTYEEAITKARACVEKHLGRDPGVIPWRVGTVDPFDEDDYRAELHLLNGTPPKGFVVVVRYNYGSDGKVIAFDLLMTRLAEWKWNTARIATAKHG
jgi:hypothetical protein